MNPPLSPMRAIWLLTSMRLLRQYNQLASAFSFASKKKKTNATARSANGGKRNARWLLSLAVGAMMLIALTNMSRTALLTMQCRLVTDSACAQTLASAKKDFSDRLASAELHGTAFDPTLLTALGMVLAILLAIAVLLPLASKELAKPDGDLEWLVTLPVARSTLLWGRLVERSAGNLAGMFALFPLYLMIAWYSGYRWSAAPIALLASALLLPLAALLHTLADTGLRMWLAASQLRNLQALISITNIPLIYLVIALGMPQASGFVVELVRHAPSWLLWLAPGLLLQLIQAQSLAQAGPLAALLLAQLGLSMWAGVALMRYQLRHGVVGSGVRESTRSTAEAVAKNSPRTTLLRARLSNALSPVMRRELRLLARDRNFLVQTLLLPLIMVGSQMVFNGKLDTLAHFGQMPSVAAAIAFGIGVYVLMLSAFQTLNNEGNALWLLYTVPRSLESVLKEKARLWSVLALVYPLMIAAITAASAPQLDWQLLVLLLIVVAGIPIYSTIAVALGVFACDPGAAELHKRIRPTYSYLFLLLTSFYTWSLYTSVWSQKVVILVLSAALALALWQKARDALPYLLDPAAAPPARVAAADGLMAATAFFILQAIIVLVITPEAQQAGLQVMTAAFGGAGLLVYAMMRLIYRRAQSVGVPRILGAGDATGSRWWQPLHQAAAPCALACTLALAYLYGLRQLEVEIPATAVSMRDYLWMVALTVFAAPLCEEFIFRGLIYGGLRRSLPAWQAMAASAAIFAVVHPPLSMLPVFVLGLCTAWAYERSKALLAPMLVHGAYNAVILLVT